MHMKQPQKRPGYGRKVSRFVIHTVLLWLVSTALIVGLILSRLYEVSYPIFLIISILIPFGIFTYIDGVLFPGFDTLAELRRGNVAVALYVLAYAVVSAAAIVAASGSLGTIFGAP